MTRAKMCVRQRDTHMRQVRVLGSLLEHHQPRKYFKNLGLSRSLKWLVDHGHVEVSRTGNVYITDAGRSYLGAMV